MKGIELPVNLLVIILIAVIVLLSVTALYFSGWIFPAQTISIESVKYDACRRLSTDCYGSVNLITIKNFDADSDGEINPGIAIDDSPTACKVGSTGNDNLYMLCKCYYNNATEDECRDICGCKGIAQISNHGPPCPDGTAVC